jgi:hypothetical protein
MPLSRRSRIGAGVLAAALLLGPVAGCARRLQRPAETAEPVHKPPPPVETPEPEPLPPPPSEAELALEAARRAEAHGDGVTAASLYARAANTSLDAGRRAEALCKLALLHTEPGGVRDLALARGDLQQFVEMFPEHPWAREARAILTLMDELDAAHAQSAALRNDVEASRLEAASLKADLEKKDQELKSIKQVLLQRKP